MCVCVRVCINRLFSDNHMMTIHNVVAIYLIVFFSPFVGRLVGWSAGRHRFDAGLRFTMPKCPWNGFGSDQHFDHIITYPIPIWICFRRTIDADNLTNGKFSTIAKKKKKIGGRYPLSVVCKLNLSGSFSFTLSVYNRKSQRIWMWMCNVQIFTNSLQFAICSFTRILFNSHAH